MDIDPPKENMEDVSNGSGEIQLEVDVVDGNTGDVFVNPDVIQDNQEKDLNGDGDIDLKKSSKVYTGKIGALPALKLHEFGTDPQAHGQSPAFIKKSGPTSFAEERKLALKVLEQTPQADSIRAAPPKLLNLHKKGIDILNRNNIQFITMTQRRNGLQKTLFKDERTENFLNTYALINTVNTEKTPSIMSPNVLPRNILCICTLSIGANPNVDYYAMYSKVNLQLKTYKTSLKQEGNWDEEDAAEILEDAIREHVPTTFKKYCGVATLTENPTVFSKGKAAVLSAWLNEIKDYIKEAEKRFMAKIMEKEKMELQMIAPKRKDQENNSIDDHFVDTENLMADDEDTA